MFGLPGTGGGGGGVAGTDGEIGLVNGASLGVGDSVSGPEAGIAGPEVGVPGPGTGAAEVGGETAGALDPTHEQPQKFSTEYIICACRLETHNQYD